MLKSDEDLLRFAYRNIKIKRPEELDASVKCPTCEIVYIRLTDVRQRRICRFCES